MADTLKYGPQTAEVEALLERARALTNAEARALGAAWYAALDAALDAVWDAAQAAALDAVWDAALDAALDAARGAVGDAVWDAAQAAAPEAAWGAALDAVLALIARDLITPDKFTQAHYDLLTRPWRKVVGRVHPDDEEMK